MTQIGRSPFSYKAPDVGRFGGMSFETTGQPYQFELLENCYVAGGEIRAFPGSQVVLDPVTDERLATDTTPFSPRGYDRDHYDAQRPTYTTSGSYKVPTTPTESQIVWTRPTTLHSVHFLANRWVFVGESDGRREPIYNAGRTAWVYVTAYQGDGAGTNFDITLNAAPDDTANVFNAVRAGSTIYLEGLTGDHAAVLNNKQHLVSAVVGSVVTITTNYTGSHAAFTGQTGFIGRVTHSYNFNNLGQQNAYEVGADLESLTVWRTQTNSASADNPDDLLYCSHVANRRRDFGDATGNILEGSSEAGYAYSRRIQKPLPYRVVPHHAGNRLVLAAPGYGCVFQVPHVVPSALNGTSGASGAGGQSNSDLDQPRALGVPKCVAVTDPDNNSTDSGHIRTVVSAVDAFGGSDGSVSGRVGTYKWRFAYRDEATGEIGIPSDEVEVTTTSGSPTYQGLRFPIYFPGYLMPECLAYSILAYRTKKDGEEYFLNEVIPMRSMDPSGSALDPGEESGRYGMKPAGSASTVGYWFHIIYQPNYKSDADLEAASGDNVMPDGNKQMPMGCKAAYTYRGYTLFGGALGDSGPWREMQTGMLQALYEKVASGANAIGYYHDRLSSRFSPAAGTVTPYMSISTPFNIGSAIIPPAYAGQQLYCPSILPYPAHLVTLDVMTNTSVPTPTAGTWYDTRKSLPDVQYRILESPIRSDVDYPVNRGECFLLLPRNQVQVSNPDHPGETPATNTIVLANEHGEDVEAMGSYAGQPVLATRTKTYMLGFSTTPVGANPEIVSDRFGCIAPNTMVEFDGGCAWISDRGPVALTGNGFQWIGKPLHKWFTESTSRYKRDSLGMMRHAWACHDPIRGLIYFGLFADLQAGTSAEATVSYRGTSYSWTDTDGVGSLTADQIRSRFPCDEVLVYSYRDDAWSVWRPHDDLAVQWMTVGQDTDRNLRVFWLGSDKRLYALDDLWGTLDDDSSYTAISTTGSTTTISGLTTGVRMRVGMDVAFYKGGAGVELEFIGLRTIASKTDSSITLDSAITLPVGGCKMLVGPRRFTVKTNWASWKQSDATTLGKLGLRYSLWSGYSTSGGTGTRHAAFAKVTVRSASKQDGYMTRKESSLTAGGYSPLAEDTPEIQTFETGYALGMSQGHSFQVELDVVGGTQVRLQDLFAEVG